MRYSPFLAFTLLLSACASFAPGLNSNSPPAVLQAQSQNRANRPGLQTLPGQTIVRLKSGVLPDGFAARHGLRLKQALGLNMFVFEGAKPFQVLAADSAALWAEPDYAIQLPALQPRNLSTPLPRQDNPALPNDPLLPAEYGFALTGTDKIWQSQPGRPEVIVAVVDSGIDASHPEFQGQLVEGFDFTEKVPVPGGAVDGYGHGTHVAGVIGAKANNGLGIAGIAPGCKLMPVRIFNNWGHSEGGLSTAAVIWAVDHGAKVINASWGSPMLGEAAKAAYEYAIAKDVVFVAAVGNSGKEDTEYYPGASPEAIGVSAVNSDDRWASFSTFGEWVDLAAPGANVLSTYPLKLGNGYKIMDGTSMAAPFVSAAAALVRSQYPSLTQAQVRSQLERTAKDVIMTGKDKYAGWGRVDIARAVLEAPPARR
jgi:subtilisin family serine protease